MSTFAATSWLSALLFTLLALAAVPAARAQLSETIAYQGYLTDAQGTALNTVVEFTFRLFDVPAGGEALWTESQFGVPVEEGVFSVQLGSIEPLAGVPLHQPLFLEVVFGEGGEVLAPRVPLTAVPYSLRAQALDDGALVAGDNVSIQRDGAALRISATGGGEGGVPSQLAAPDGSPAPAVSVDNDGRVGIGVGTEAVRAPLHLRRDDLGLPQSAVVSPGLAVEASDATLGAYSSEAGTFGSALVLGEINQTTLVDLWSLVRETSTGNGQSRLRFTYGGNPNYSVNETKLALTAPGNIGIGTDDPEGLLHLSSLGDAELILEADTGNNNEDRNPALLLRQDGNAANAFIALEGNAGTRSAGTLANALVIGSEDNDPALQFVTNDKVQMTIATNGAITAPPRPSILTISPLSLAPQEDENNYVFRNFLALRVGNPQRWFAPVHLPDGAVVTRATSTWVDSSTPGLITIRLNVWEPGPFESSTMAILDSVGSGGVGTRTDGSIQHATIDNRNVYYIEVDFSACQGLGCSFEFREVTIEYTTTRIH